MGKTGLAAAILLVACGSEKALAIQVSTGDSSITRIELFVGDTTCDACEGVAPPSSVTRPLGPVAYTGEGERFVAAVGPDGIAGFRIEPTAMTTTIAKLAAVGFTADNTPKGFALDESGFSVAALAGTVRRYALSDRAIGQAQGLTPAVAPHDGTDDPTDQIVVWRAPNADATTPSCLAIEHRDGTNEFLVPPRDPDCDGIVEHECDPNWYLRADPTPKACLTQVPGPACMVGTRTACLDGTDPSCVSGDMFCVPDRACALAACEPLDGPGCLAALIPAPADPASSVATLRCTGSYQTGHPDVCAGPAPILLTGVGACTAQFATIGPGAVPTTNAQMLVIDEPTFRGTLTVGVAIGNQCGLSFVPALSVKTMPAAATVVHRVFELSTSTRTLIVPIVIDLQPLATPCSTSSAMKCTLTNQMTDSIYSCLR
jgi:hypothetical protein